MSSQPGMFKRLWVKLTSTKMLAFLITMWVIDRQAAHFGASGEWLAYTIIFVVASVTGFTMMQRTGGVQGIFQRKEQEER